MVPQKDYAFAKNITAEYTPNKPYYNVNSDVMSVEISGTFTSGEFVFEGKLDANSEDYTPLAAIDLSNLSVVRGIATKAGIYELGIEGIREFRVRVQSVSGGYVNIIGRVVNMGG